MSEKDLVCAIIERAYHDSLGEVTAIEHADKEDIILRAQEWINSTSKKFASFEWYCSLVHISPEPIRKKMHRDIIAGKVIPPKNMKGEKDEVQKKANRDT